MRLFRKLYPQAATSLHQDGTLIVGDAGAIWTERGGGEVAFVASSRGTPPGPYFSTHRERFVVTDPADHLHAVSAAAAALLSPHSD
jgi:hypothetical protein